MPSLRVLSHAFRAWRRNLRWRKHEPETPYLADLLSGAPGLPARGRQRRAPLLRHDPGGAQGDDLRHRAVGLLLRGAEDHAGLARHRRPGDAGPRRGRRQGRRDAAGHPAQDLRPHGPRLRLRRRRAPARQGPPGPAGHRHGAAAHAGDHPRRLLRRARRSAGSTSSAWTSRAPS